MSIRRGLDLVLSTIRFGVERYRPDEESIAKAAYLVWCGRGEGKGHDRDDWFEACRRLAVEKELALFADASRNAVNGFDHQLQLELSVVRRVATFLRKRPTEIRSSTSLFELDEHQLGLIIAGVEHDLRYIFSKHYTYATCVRGLANDLWDGEYRFYRGN